MKEKISVIIPVYNEKANIFPLYKRLEKMLKDHSYEILFVDDGSTDATTKEIEKIHNKNKKVKLISFNQNYGKSAAMQAGFDNTTGETLILMDGDLQDVPEEILKFIDAVKNADLVVGWRHKRRDKLAKRLASKIFNNLLRIIIGLGIHDANCGFKALRREVAESINMYGELHRYLPALAYVKGYKVNEIKIKHAERLHGRTKYGLSRMWKGFFDLMTVKFLSSFAKRPFHLFGGFGILSFLAGVVIGLWLFVLWFIYGNIGGHTPAAILSVLLVILGVQLISLGLIGEMIASLKAKDKPYKIKRKL